MPHSSLFRVSGSHRILANTTTPIYSRNSAHAGSANSAASTAPLVRRSRRPGRGPFSSTLAKIFMGFRELQCDDFASPPRFTGLCSPSACRHETFQLFKPVLDDDQCERVVFGRALDALDHQKPLAIRRDVVR